MKEPQSNLQEKVKLNILKELFLKNRPIHFLINDTSFIRLVKRNHWSFSNIELNSTSHILP